MQALADTTVWSWRGRAESVAMELTARLERMEIVTCPMIKFELLVSARNGREFDEIRMDLDELDDCAIGPGEWRRALDVYRTLAHQGGAHQRSVGHQDLLIAAAASQPAWSCCTTTRTSTASPRSPVSPRAGSCRGGACSASGLEMGKWVQGRRPTPRPQPRRVPRPREARSTADRVLEHVWTGAGLQRETLGERHPEAVDRGGAVGEHRALREAGEILGQLQRALEVAAGGTTSVTSPIESASEASMMRPVRIMSSARPRPTMRGRRWVPPSIRERPSGARGSRGASPPWRSAGRTTAPAPARRRARSRRSRRRSASMA